MWEGLRTCRAEPRVTLVAGVTQAVARLEPQVRQNVMCAGAAAASKQGPSTVRGTVLYKPGNTELHVNGICSFAGILRGGCIPAGGLGNAAAASLPETATLLVLQCAGRPAQCMLVSRGICVMQTS